MAEHSNFTELWVVAAVFAVSYVAIHIIFVRLVPLSELRWKQADYAWILLTSVSLLSAVTAGRQLESKLIYEGSKASWDVGNRLIMERMAWARQYFCDTKFTKGEFSPPDFDQKQVEQGQACAWFRVAYQNSEGELRSESPNLRRELFPRPPSFGLGSIEAQEVRELLQSVAEHESFTAKRRQLFEQSEMSMLELMLAFLSPSILAFAFAIRLAKVSGEIRIARLKANSQRP